MAKEEKKDSRLTRDSKGTGKDKKDKPAAAAAKPGGVVHKVSSVKRTPQSTDFRGVVRVVGKDMDGHLRIQEALRKIRGIGHSLSLPLSKAISRELSISPATLIGDVPEDQLEKIEELVKNPTAHGIPTFMINRQKDYDAGTNRHLLGTDLVFQTKQDIDREKETRSWVGWRHSLGQKVRGQHTRTTGRTGMSVGVMRKTIAAAQKAAAGESKDEKK